MQIEAGTREPIKTDVKRREQLRHTIEQENYSDKRLEKWTNQTDILTREQFR